MFIMQMLYPPQPQFETQIVHPPKIAEQHLFQPVCGQIFPQVVLICTFTCNHNHNCFSFTASSFQIQEGDTQIRILNARQKVAVKHRSFFRFK
jgi:hypothetical protein